MSAIPRVWREPTDHSSNCIFCMVNPSKRCTDNNAPQVIYPDLPSSIAPVLPRTVVPTPSKRDQSSSGDYNNSGKDEDIGDPDYGFTDAVKERKPCFPNQKDLNDLIRDLTKSNAELLKFMLKQWNLLD
ncbi:Uncharacterized protein FKW44_008962 [Caligus rogercresseyi]|uniref:Uncharacterized protein n=1 Tax=Caligus rogercresseyi TaxID=217165 RepID=A0A7T8K752_CALRO|nr:Uncharacterized protein FKW44_008962 [Caligus rogercresseyi]